MDYEEVVSRKVYIEDGGTGYNGGDIVVFDNSNADGSAELVIGAIEDTVILENRSEWGQFEITATAGQTLFNGTDDNGQLILFNDNSVTVSLMVLKKHLTQIIHLKMIELHLKQWTICQVQS